MTEELLRVEGVCKKGALSHFSFRIDQGEIAGLVGPNGSGKTMAAAILCGLESPEAGRMYWRERQLPFGTVVQARRNGIYHISDRSQLIDYFTVAENLYYSLSDRIVFLHRRKWQFVMAAELFARYDVQIDVRRRATTLTEFERFQVDIMLAMAGQARLLVVAGTFGRFTAEQNRYLLRLFHTIAAQGTSILLVSAHEEAIMGLAQRIWLMRDGENCGLLYQEYYAAYLQHRVPPAEVQRSAEQGESAFALQGVMLNGTRLVDLAVRTGEVVGIVESDERLRALFLQLLRGMHQSEQGLIRFFGTVCGRLRIGRDFALIDGRRIYQDLFGNLTVRENFTMLMREKIAACHGLIFRKRLIRFICRQYEAQVHVHGKEWEWSVSSLTHAQQQAVSLYRWKVAGLRFAVFVYPFYETDADARASMRAFIAELVVEGWAVLLLSQNYDMLHECCNRITHLRA